MSWSKVHEVARGEIGKTEYPPGSNITPYGEAYGLNGVPWCVIGLWWVFQVAGEGMAFFGGAKTARCSVLMEWYKQQGMLVPFTDAQPADIVFLNFNGKGTPDHCGLVTERRGVLLYTVEFNTTPGLEGSQDNGGSVAEKIRYPYQIVAVARPQYKEEEVPKDDFTGHWAEQSIRRVMAHGFMKGFPDGTFRPDQAVTRAELATILDRLELAGRLEKKGDDVK